MWALVKTLLPHSLICLFQKNKIIAYYFTFINKNPKKILLSGLHLEKEVGHKRDFK